MSDLTAMERIAQLESQLAALVVRVQQLESAQSPTDGVARHWITSPQRGSPGGEGSSHGA